jgi:hypothetical protein
MYSPLIGRGKKSAELFHWLLPDIILQLLACKKQKAAKRQKQSSTKFSLGWVWVSQG